MKITTGWVLVSLMFFTACSNGKSKGNKAADTDSSITSAPKLDLENFSDAKLRLTVYQKLQGKWVSDEDKNSQIEFKDYQYIDYYEKSKIAENKFILDKACTGENGAGKPGPDELYLISDDMCWYINEVNDSILNLTYMARGNTLIYKKVK